MCWNERTSWMTFIIGSLANIFSLSYMQNITFLQLFLIFQYILFIQLFEALAWRDQNCGKLNKFATKSILMNNILQPVVLFIILFIFTSASNTNKIIATTLVIIYLVYILGNLNEKKYNCLKPTQDCPHLQYVWWRDMSYGAILYLVSFIASFLLLLRPLSFSITLLTFLMGTLFLSFKDYICAVGSMWCWFGAFTPLFTLLFWKLFT